MNINILSVDSELGTPYFILRYEIKDGSLLLSSGYVVTRQEWLSKPFADHTQDDYKQIVYLELQRYTSSLKNHDDAIIKLYKEEL
jgi:hypothetical protein